jgi:hypothetical protein
MHAAISKVENFAQGSSCQLKFVHEGAQKLKGENLKVIAVPMLIFKKVDTKKMSNLHLSTYF